MSAASAPERTAEKDPGETLAGPDFWPAAGGSCPDDCHYCSGPETD
ncbi:hypothetical protein [Pseudarthrobacter sp. H2]